MLGQNCLKYFYVTLMHIWYQKELKCLLALSCRPVGAVYIDITTIRSVGDVLTVILFTFIICSDQGDVLTSLCGPLPIACLVGSVQHALSFCSLSLYAVIRVMC